MLSQDDIRGEEAQILSLLISEPEQSVEVYSLIEPKHFATPCMRSLASIIWGMGGSGVQVSTNSVLERLESEDSKKALFEVLGVFCSAANLDVLCSRIKGRHVRQKIKERSGQLLQKSDDFTIEPEDLLKQWDDLTLEICEKESTVKEMPEVIDEVMAALNSIVQGNSWTTKSGMAWFDDYYGGYEPSEVHIIAGDSGSGKTGLSIEAIVSFAKQGKSVLFYSIEMSRKQIGLRMLAYVTGLDSNALKYKNYLLKHEQRIKEGRDFLRTLKITIDDKSTQTPKSVRLKAKSMKRLGTLDLIAWDYAQIMQATTKTGSTIDDLTSVVSDLKALCKDLEVPGLLLSQIKRSNENRAIKKPTMTDMSGSSGLEKNASLILIIFRSWLYEPEGQKVTSPNKVTLIAAKTRHISNLPELNLYADLSCSRFRSWLESDQKDYDNQQFQRAM